MEMVIFILAVLVIGGSLIWQQSEPEKQKKLWHEFYAEKYVYEMEPFYPDMYYWDNRKNFKKIQERTRISYNQIQKIMAVYDRNLEKERGWKVYFLMKNGRIIKGYMLSDNLTPKRLE